MTTAHLEMAVKHVDYSTDSGMRQKGITVIKPIVYGNIARYFGKKREEDGHTHQWTVYFKPFNNEDVSAYVKKVHFKLHDSYTNSTRVVTKPPYEVTETGWGEFEVIIKIYFHDSMERPVTVYHLLKLFQSDPDIMLGKKSLVVEYYDELVFQDPSVLLHKQLCIKRPLVLGGYKHEIDFDDRRARQTAAVLTAKQKVRQEIQQLNERLKHARHAITLYKGELSQLAAEQGALIST